jgi:hypothetical protein
MPLVPELNLPKFEQPKYFSSPSQLGTRNFKVTEESRPNKKSKHGPVRKYKLIDKSLIHDDIANRNHLKNIKNEL